MLIEFPPIFVADTKIIYSYNFVAPLSANLCICQSSLEFFHLFCALFFYAVYFRTFTMVYDVIVMFKFALAFDQKWRNNFFNCVCHVWFYMTWKNIPYLLLSFFYYEVTFFTLTGYDSSRMFTLILFLDSNQNYVGGAFSVRLPHAFKLIL